MKWYGLYNTKVGCWMQNTQGDIRWEPRALLFDVLRARERRG